MRLECEGCGAKLIIKGAKSLDKVTKIECGKCGKVNRLYKKSNGKFRIRTS